MRLFKGIICDDISEFESHVPSHAVGSLWRVYPVHGLCELWMVLTHPHRVLADAEDDRDRLLALAADLVRRRVAAAPANAPALAAKAATPTGTGTTSSTMPSTPASAEVALGPIPNLPKAVRAACRAV